MKWENTVGRRLMVIKGGGAEDQPERRVLVKGRLRVRVSIEKGQKRFHR